MVTGCGFIAVGVFFLFGAICNWGVLMNSVKARMWITGIGTIGARVFYVCCGLFFVVAGILCLLGLMPDPANRFY